MSIAWGTTYAGMKVAIESLPPFLMAGIRFTLAGAILLLGVRAFGIPFPTFRDWKRIALVGCLLLTGANGLLAWAQQYVPSSFSALMVNTGPLIYVGLSAMLGERVPRLAWAGLLVGFCGVFVLVSPRLFALFGGHAPETVTPHFWWAIGALVLGPITWSSGSVVANRYPPACHSLMTAAGQTLAGGLGALVVAAFLGDLAQPIHPSARSIQAIVYLIVVGSWLGYVSFMYCVMNLPSQIVATTTYLNIIVAILVGATLLSEKVTVSMLAGGGVILAGVAIVNWAKFATRKTAPAKAG